MPTTRPVEFIPDVRFAPALKPDVSKFAKDFLVKGLYETLIEFGCGPFELDAHIDWFWHEHKFWKATTFAEFVTVARKRLNDRLGYTKRRNVAATTVARLFDKALYMPVTLDDVVESITVLAPTQKMPNEVFANDRAAIVDVTSRPSSPRLLKVEADFLPILEKLYPWRREDDRIVKTLPGAPRDLDINVLAFWRLFPDTTPQEIETARVFRNGDKLDWTQGNLRSKWRDAAERQKAAVPAEYMEPSTADGSVRHFHRGHVSWPSSDALLGTD